MEARSRAGSSAPVHRRDLDRLITVARRTPDHDVPEISPTTLLPWFAEQGRDLPWRRTRDPWVIMVSERMLQQTQVARVLDRLPRFVQRFATPTDCAAAAAGEVIEEWKGLGYNRRALNLHRAATIIASDHAGAVPRDRTALLALPGVGNYTARAVRAFAFELDDGVLDTNVGRVLARVGGRALKPAEAQRAADALVPEGEGWVWNQAMMEVGALHCRPRPRCGACPLAGECRWQLAGRPTPDPAATSAAVSRRQSRFEGSDRQGRGRLIDALRQGEVANGDLPVVMGWANDAERAEAVANTLVDDGLAILRDGVFRLP